MRLSFSPRELLLLAFTLTAEAQQTATVRGIVSGPDGPLPQATVFIQTGNTTVAQVVTDSAGAFQVAAPHGEIQVDVTKAGMTTVSTPTLLEADFDMRVRLDRIIAITGHVRGPGGSLTGAAITVRALHGVLRYQTSTSSGTFTIESPAAPVVVEAVPTDGRLRPARRNLDLSTVNTANVEINVAVDGPPLLPFYPPIADRITTTEPDASGMVRVRGAAGAADPLSAIFVANLGAEHVSFGVSAADGSFDVPMFAPPGSYILIRHDAAARYLAPRTDIGQGFGASREGPAGTIIRTRDHAVPAGQTAVNLIAAIAHNVQDDPREYPTGAIHDSGQLWLSGSMPQRAYAPGEVVQMSGRLTLFSRDIGESTDISQIRVTMFPGLRRFFAGGRFHLQVDHATTALTPSGLPIQMTSFSAPGNGNWSHTPLRHAGTNRLEAEWTLAFTIPAVSEPGIYVPHVNPMVSGMPPRRRHLDVFPRFRGMSKSIYAFPYVAVGTSEPRLPWILAFDEAAGGLRGTMTDDDRRRFAIANHIRFNGDTFALPPTDSRGQRTHVRLEPHVPVTLSGGSSIAAVPDVPLRFPSGTLAVSVIRPDGVVEDLGNAPFRQIAMRAPLTRNGYPSHGLSAHLGEVSQLTTLDPRFGYTFTQTGVYTIAMTGSVEDVRGVVYRGGGTYRITIARPLDFETAILAGTPFETNDVASLTVVTQPGVPAKVTTRVRSWSDTTLVADRMITGKANRFGVFTADETFRFDTAGEYRIDVDVEHVDETGTHWAGTTTWGSVVETPGSPLITRGRRGFDCVNAVQERWFTAERAAGCDHIMFPFDGGDVLWLRDTRPHGRAGMPALSIQDPEGTFTSILRRAHPQCCFDLPFETRRTIGELPLLPSTQTTSPYAATDFGYFYGIAERPGVHVRQIITDDQGIGSGYWRFSDYYDFQSGNGFLGDLPNDFKFQFGGAVYRSQREQFFYYGGYASLFVLVPDDDPNGNRLMPPFRGNGGGPDGGPVMRLKGKTIDLFFHPTGVRPGSIFDRGNRISFAGYSAPPLRSKITIDWTSPSGVTRTVSGQANKYGYFSDIAADTRLDEAGLWRASVRILFDGFMSAGQVTPPYPAGDVLGSRDGEFWFYVVEPNAPPLQVTASSATLNTSAAGTRFVRPADGPVTFTVTPPSGLTYLELHTTTTMPGFILEEIRQTPTANSQLLTYVYDAVRLAQDFPNLDLHDPDGFAGADTITISFFLSGTDGTGTRRHFARQIVIQGEELQMPEQKETSIPPRRRAAGR